MDAHPKFKKATLKSRLHYTTLRTFDVTMIGLRRIVNAIHGRAVTEPRIFAAPIKMFESTRQACDVKAQIRIADLIKYFICILYACT